MCVCVCVCYHSNESTKVHKPWHRHNACRQRKDIEGKMNCHSEWVMRRAPGEPADSKSMSGPKKYMDRAKCLQVFCTSDP